MTTRRSKAGQGHAARLKRARAAVSAEDTLKALDAVAGALERVTGALAAQNLALQRIEHRLADAVPVVPRPNSNEAPGGVGRAA